jgi:CRP/FNR family transcriptional regulator, anaerobic regulatory protein
MDSILTSLDQLKKLALTYIPLSEEQWLDIATYFKEIRLAKNEYLFREGQTSRHIYFICSGLIRNYYLKDGIEITRHFAQENELLSAYISFLTQTPTFENVHTLEECRLLQISYDDLQYVYAKYPVWGNFFRQLLEKVYIETTKRIEGFICKTAKERYIDLITRRPDLFQRVSLQHLSTYLGITPVSLSRIRKTIHS